MRPNDHARARRVAAKQIATGTVSCCRCGGSIRPGDKWDLDHIDTPFVDGGQGRRLPSHVWCNRSHGGHLGNQRRRARKAGTPVNFSALGVEISGDRSKTWIARAGRNSRGLIVVQLDDPSPGTDAIGRIVQLWTKSGIDHVLLDPHSQSATLAAPLANEGLPLREVSARDMAAAHGIFLDALLAGQLKHRGHPALGVAVRAAAERPLAGARAVDRRAGDPAPMVAAELAVFGVPDEAEGLGPEDVFVGRF